MTETILVVNAGSSSLVRPPPISGSAGLKRASAAKRLKNSSSAPNTMEGRRMIAEGNSARTATSPAAFVRAYSALDLLSAPIAEI